LMPSGIFLKEMPPRAISKWQQVNRNRSRGGRLRFAPQQASPDNLMTGGPLIVPVICPCMTINDDRKSTSKVYPPRRSFPAY
jgi:hypothetical protein